MHELDKIEMLRKQNEELKAELQATKAAHALAEEFHSDIYKLALKLSEEKINLTVQKNQAYAERNKLVAALSKLFPASLERHPDEDTTWEDDWRWIVFIELPTGQATWHIHDSELSLFDHLARNCGQKWDGHTTEEKYQRLTNLQPQFKRVENFREGQKILWQGRTYTLEEITPYGIDDYLLCLEGSWQVDGVTWGSSCPVPLSVYNETLKREADK